MLLSNALDKERIDVLHKGRSTHVCALYQIGKISMFAFLQLGSIYNYSILVKRSTKFVEMFQRFKMTSYKWNSLFALCKIFYGIQFS